VATVIRSEPTRSQFIRSGSLATDPCEDRPPHPLRE